MFHKFHKSVNDKLTDLVDSYYEMETKLRILGNQKKYAFQKLKFFSQYYTIKGIFYMQLNDKNQSESQHGKFSLK